MGQKTHPLGFRLGITKDWQAHWYARKSDYARLLQEDLALRRAILAKYPGGDIAQVDIERGANEIGITIQTAKPGLVIGRGGQQVDQLRASLEAATGKKVRLTIREIREPELNAYLVARNVAQQLEKRVSYRRAIKQAVSRSMQRGAKGVKIICSGRLGGGELSRREKAREGSCPINTLTADIDFARVEARTTLGRIGVKAWIYRGPVVTEEETPSL